nr:lysophospholipase D GDPD3 isoform X2 [Camelus dromedarius]
MWNKEEAVQTGPTGGEEAGGRGGKEGGQAPGTHPSCPTQDLESAWRTPWRPWRSESTCPAKLPGKVVPAVCGMTLKGAIYLLVWVTGAPGRCAVHSLHIRPELPHVPLKRPTILPSGPSLSVPHPLTDLHSHSSMTQRADLLELDCQLTRDGVVVVSHDKNLSRQSGVNRDIGSLDFEELPLLKEELEVYFSPGHFTHGSDRHMVRLEDVFRRFPRTPISVEIKEENEELIYKTADLVRNFDRNEITIWASGKSSIMKKCKAANPEMPTSLTLSRGLWVLLLYYLGLLPFISIPEKFLICFLPTIINRTYFPFPCSGLNQLAAVVSKWLIMRKSLIQHLEQRGVQVIFWCLNEESDFKAAFDLGATGVITDYPTALRRYLDNHGPPAPSY